MKTRIAALVLALAVSLAGASSALGVSGVVKGKLKNAPELGGNQYIKVGNAEYTGSSTSITLDYNLYAFQETTKLGKQLSWKPIKITDLTVDGKINLSTVLKKAGVLILCNAAEAKQAATNTSVIDALTGGDVTYVIYDVGKPGERPKLDKLKYNVAGYEGKAWLSLPENLEYMPLYGTEWKPLANGDSFPGFTVKDYKQEFMVRFIATGGNGPSPSVKLSIPAYTTAPSVKIDTAKGLFAGKNGFEVALGASDPNVITPAKTYTLTSSTKNIALGDTTIGGADCGVTINSSTVLWVRVPPTERKPASPWVRVDFGQAAVLGAAELPSDLMDILAFAPKRLVQVTGSTPVEYKKNGKWTKVKNFKAADLEVAEVEIRMAGSKLKWPSESIKIKLEKGAIVKVN